MEEAGGKSEVSQVRERAGEKPVVDRADYLTNTATAATKTIADIGPAITQERGSLE